MTRQTILVVEDSDDIRHMMKFMLEMKGLRMVEAVNGREAIERALGESPQLILMDLSMPVMDGWEATRKLRQYEPTREVPIVAISAHCREEQREQALRAGGRPRA
jgi:two-component system cell cycle response regulator DivK